MRNKIWESRVSNGTWSRGAVPLIPLVIIGVITVVSAITAILNTNELTNKKTITSRAVVGCNACVRGVCQINRNQPPCIPEYPCSDALPCPTVPPSRTPTPGGPPPPPPPTEPPRPPGCTASGDHWAIATNPSYSDTCITQGWASAGTGANEVYLYIDGQYKSTYPANLPDAGSNNKKFSIHLREFIKDTVQHEIRIKTRTSCGEEWTISNSPQRITCNKPPTCNIAPYPATGNSTTVTAGSKVTYTATCSDTDGISECRVLYNSIPPADTVPPVGDQGWQYKPCTTSPCTYEVTWPKGKYYITADAVDKKGNRSSGNPWCDWTPNPPNTINCSRQYNASDCGSKDVYIVNVTDASVTPTPTGPVNTSTPTPTGSTVTPTRTRTPTKTPTGGPPSCDLGVTLTAIPNYGPVPLNRVDLKAQVSGTTRGTITYRFKCNQANATWGSPSTGPNPYIATNLCNYSTRGIKTAAVKVDRGGCTTTNTTTINVGNVATPTPSRTPSPTPTGPTSSPTPTPTLTPSPTPTGPTSSPTPSPTQSPQSGKLKFKIKFTDPSASFTNLPALDIKLELMDSANNIVASSADLTRNGDYFQTASDASFNITQNGTYTLYIKAKTSLRRSFGGIVLTQSQSLDCTTGTNTNCGELASVDGKVFLSGDSDGFNTASGSYNKIDSADLQVLATQYNTSAPTSGNTGDFNYDGTVDISDLEILGRNYGQAGD